jgi:hypothetical protein
LRHPPFAAECGNGPTHGDQYGAINNLVGTGGRLRGAASLHAFVLPRPEADRRAPAAARHLVRDFLAVFAAFFRKPEIGVTLAFLLLYR